MSYIVGDDDLGVPKKIILKNYGKVAEKYIKSIVKHYQNVFVDNYIIMPNHIHLLIRIDDFEARQKGALNTENNGTPRSSSPTLSNIIQAFKHLTNKECKTILWQRGFYDHVVRNLKDYENAWDYIEYNALKEYK